MHSLANPARHFSQINLAPGDQSQKVSHPSRRARGNYPSISRTHPAERLSLSGVNTLLFNTPPSLLTFRKCGLRNNFFTLSANQLSS